MKTILIADPNPATRNALKLILKHRLGAEEIYEAGDLETLIRALTDLTPEILLLDWTLYGIPATETCFLLNKAYPGLKIILLSADANDVVLAEKAGVAFVHKGAAPDALITLLKMAS